MAKKQGRRSSDYDETRVAIVLSITMFIVLAIVVWSMLDYP